MPKQTETLALCQYCNLPKIYENPDCSAHTVLLAAHKDELIVQVDYPRIENISLETFFSIAADAVCDTQGITPAMLIAPSKDTRARLGRLMVAHAIQMMFIPSHQTRVTQKDISSLLKRSKDWFALSNPDFKRQLHSASADGAILRNKWSRFVHRLTVHIP